MAAPVGLDFSWWNTDARTDEKLKEAGQAILSYFKSHGFITLRNTGIASSKEVCACYSLDIYKLSSVVHNCI